ncbi:MAG: hypothetical protein IPQ07_05185 [Myxococcales bacterium]|nr:hypothetical protein [Myxococcales bacterium]
MNSSRLLLASALVALAIVPGCKKLPSSGGIPNKPNVPGGLGGASGEVDPNTCGNYAAQDAGRKLKAFLQATKDLEATTVETVKVVKESCLMMGHELGMSEADLGGETNDICAKVVTAYQNNLKVSLKPNAKLKITYKPAVCKVDVSVQAKAQAECEGSATAGTGGNSGSGQCAAAAAVNASASMTCTEAELTIDADAKLTVDKSKLDMTLKALRVGLPKLLSLKARLEPLQAAVKVWAKTAADLKDMGPKFAQSFSDQALCISGQIAAAANAATHIEANVSVSVSVTASASATAGG